MHDDDINRYMEFEYVFFADGSVEYSYFEMKMDDYSFYIYGKYLGTYTINEVDGESRTASISVNLTNREGGYGECNVRKSICVEYDYKFDEISIKSKVSNELMGMRYFTKEVDAE